MSMYVEWINSIKSQATVDWLTDAQREAYNSIVTRWPQSRFVCLCGPSGSGKSFIARLLSSNHGYCHAWSLEEVPAGTARVVLEGCAYNRLMRPAAEDKGITRLVLLLRQPPKDRMPCADLELCARDVHQFEHNLTHNGVLASIRGEYDTLDLGYILRNEAIIRGDENAA